MKALIYRGPENLSYEETSNPAVELGDCLIKVEAVGICGSDMHAYLGHDERRIAPLILGHEAAGLVLEGPLQGKRVTVNPLVTCLECPTCKSGKTNLCPNRQIISMQPREGAFADYIRMPSRNLIVMPDGFDASKACMVEPIACGWHAARKAQKLLDIPLSEAKCAILGGGAIGVGAALSLQALGATTISIAEPHAEKRQKLADIGPFSLYDPTCETAPFKGEIDLVIDAYGGAITRASASEIVAPGGLITHIGLAGGEGGLDIRRMTLQEITFLGTYTYTEQDFAETAQAMFDGRLGALDWAQERPLNEGAQAFADILQARVAAPKVVLIP